MAFKEKNKKLRGMLIVFEGTEGAGKTTQSELLVKALQDAGYKARRYKFPTNTVSGKLAYAYLNNEIDSDSLDGYQAASLYLVDMVCHAKEIKDAVNNGEFVIVDRYVGTNFYNQSVRSIRFDSFDFTLELKRFIHIIKDIAYNRLSIPRPDTTIFLELSYEASKKHREADNNRIVKDFHEKDEKYVERVTTTAVTAASLEKWKIVSCDNKTIEEVHEDIMDVINEELSKNYKYFNLLTK